MSSDDAVASKFDGEWSLSSCNVASGYLRDKKGFVICHEASNPFDIDLWIADSVICGYYESVAYDGNKIDDGFIVESSQKPITKEDVNGLTINVDFFGGFTNGGKGHATIKVVGKKLYWIVENSQGEFYLEDKAVLKRHKRTFHDDRTQCPPVDLIKMQKYESDMPKLESK